MPPLQQRPGTGHVRRGHRRSVELRESAAGDRRVDIDARREQFDGRGVVAEIGTLGSPAGAPPGHSGEPGHTPLVVAPTATAVEMQAGAEIAAADGVVARRR